MFKVVSDKVKLFQYDNSTFNCDVAMEEINNFLEIEDAELYSVDVKQLANCVLFIIMYGG